MFVSGRKKIRLYISPEGNRPFRSWYDSLQDDRTKAVVKQRIDRLELGNVGDCKYIDQGVYELRIHYGPGYRIYFGNDGPSIVILLCGGKKETQKKDIKKSPKILGGIQGGEEKCP